ncbi:MFS transporter [Deinococcus sp. HMF7620]|uniref:MFS transporter n=1 Tax=Deinococcus arboris TaxID=2682977 RepID=A0A7C9I5N4_9DEIO|nr:MFS transporter [Deinococcus arboris]
MAGIATSFLVLHQTGSAGLMGVNLALTLLPALFSPLFGALIDRWPLRLPLLAGNLLRGALQLTVGLLALQGEVPLPVIYTASFLTGLIGAFYSPASLGVAPRLVPPAHLARASGFLQGSTQTMQLAGLIGGGVLVSAVGSAPALLADGVSFLVFATLLLGIEFPTRPPSPAGQGLWVDVRAGLAYARRSPLTLSLPVLALLINACFAPLEMLLPARMTALGAGAQGFGLFFGLLLGGLAAGSFALAALGARVPVRRLSVLGLAAMGLTVLVLSVSQTAAQMYGLAALLGLANAATNVSIGVLFQQCIAPAFYGRVGSLLTVVSMAGMPLILLLLAPLADQVPVQVIFGVAGSVTLLAALVWHGVLRLEETAAAPTNT